MSAPVAGKFQDHYEVLGVEVNADSSAIQLAYSELSQKYDLSNIETGDAEKLEAVSLAYEVLSQPDLRKEFDKLKGVGEDQSGPKFSGLEFFESLGRETGMRSAILCVLYDRRRAKPFTPSLSMRHLENILAASTDQLAFALWYLKQRGLVTSDDKSSLQISVEGMEHLESLRPSSENVMPWIKSASLLSAELTSETTAPQPEAVDSSAAPSPESEARRRAVNRILSRGTN
jgi:curved DNA-binding protein CbpA